MLTLLFILPLLCLDAPAPEATLTGTVVVEGWALETTQYINRVEIFVDGNFVANAVYGSPRQGVCEIYPGSPDCPNVGWAYSLDTTRIPNGAHTLRVVAWSSGTYSETTRPFTVENAPPKVSVLHRTVYRIDSPEDTIPCTGVVFMVFKNGELLYSPENYFVTPGGILLTVQGVTGDIIQIVWAE
jgi:hypothetical protein